MANIMGQTGLVTSFDGKSIQVNYDGSGLYLYIDGNLHTQQKGAGAVFNSKKPAIQMDFPFSSGTKKLEVYYKMGLIKQKFRLFKTAICLHCQPLTVINTSERNCKLMQPPSPENTNW